MVETSIIGLYMELESRHKRRRLIEVCGNFIIMVIGVLGWFFNIYLIPFLHVESYPLLGLFGIGFFVLAIRTWDGSDELKTLRIMVHENLGDQNDI
jgi:hypothetical protein